MSDLPSKNPWLHAGTPSWRAPVFGLMIALIATSGQRVGAADPGATPWRPPSSSLNDCQLAADARRSMMADPVLAEFNIGVTIADSTATVWGAVPDADIAARVRSRLSAVAGISTVL